MIAGTMEARKIPAMEVRPTAMQYRIMRTLGGMMGPSSDAVAITPDAKLGVYPSFFIIGIRKEPSEAGPANVSDESVDEIGQGLQEPPLDHQLACEDEERNRQEGKAVHSLKHSLGDERQGITADEEVGDRAEDQVERDGKADDQEHHEADTES